MCWAQTYREGVGGDTWKGDGIGGGHTGRGGYKRGTYGEGDIQGGYSRGTHGERRV